MPMMMANGGGEGIAPAFRGDSDGAAAGDGFNNGMVMRGAHMNSAANDAEALGASSYDRDVDGGRLLNGYHAPDGTARAAGGAKHVKKQSDAKKRKTANGGGQQG